MLASTGNNYTKFVFGTSEPVVCTGNIMHLYDYTQDLTAFPSSDTSDRGLKNMFNGATVLTSAPELPATTLCTYAYYQMFMGCTSLVTPPALPATTLSSYCYNHMFVGCTSLLYVHSFSNITGGGSHSLVSMYEGCSLIKMSETQTGEYQNEYRFWTAVGTQIAENMFLNTGGTFTGTPTRTIYYTANTIIS